MSTSLSTENIQTTISQLNRDFSGRRDFEDYVENKLIHIHRRNRPFVWNKDMQARLLDSILKGYYIPPIICSSRIVGHLERRDVMEGGNRITTFRKILNEEVRKLSPDEKNRVEAHPITLVVLRGLTARDQRMMFRRLNKNVRVSDGQLYSMSEEDSPLVQEAIAFLNDDHYPLREQITTHFFDTRGADNDRKSHLENVIALLSGILHGVHFITKSYNVQEPKIESQESIHRGRIIHVFGSILDIFTAADQHQPIQDKRKRRGQWNVGKWMGAILYEYLTHQEEIPIIQEKWTRYLVAVRRDEPGAEQASKIGGAQNLTATRYKKVCTKVDIFLRDRRVAMDEELVDIIHCHQDEEEDDYSSNEFSDDENEDL